MHNYENAGREPGAEAAGPVTPPGGLLSDPAATFRGSVAEGKEQAPVWASFMVDQLKELLNTTFSAAPRWSKPGVAGVGGEERPEDAPDFSGVETKVMERGVVPSHPLGSGYHPVRLLGRGGMGEVWEAEQRSLQRLVAIKKVRDAVGTPSTGGGQGTGEIPWGYAWQEAFIAAHLDHPNILPVYDIAQDGEGNLFIAMKRVVGRPWSLLIQEDFAQLSVEKFLARHVPILMQVTQAVVFAHSRAVVHRDIKPSQVIIGDYGEVVLLDWGLALSLAADRLPGAWKPECSPLPDMLWSAGNPAGTPAYMAPEQTLRTPQELGPWTDSYLLGGTLYTLLTGKLPIPGRTSREAFMNASRGMWTPLGVAAEGRMIPEELRRLVEDTLVVDWRQRQVTAAVFLRRLQDYQSGVARREDSVAITKQVAEQLERNRTSEDYRFYASMMSELDKARVLWGESPSIGPLRERTLSAYAGVAIGKQDLGLAEAMAGMLPNSPAKTELFERISLEQEQLLKRERQRRRARIQSVALMLVAIGVAMLAIQQRFRALGQTEVAEAALSLAKESEAHARNQQQRAEQEAYRAAIGYASASLDSLNLLQATQVLEGTPRHLRNWEWRYLVHILNQDVFRFQAPVSVLCAAWHPDGAAFVLGGERRYLTLIGRNGEEFQHYRGHGEKIYGVSFSADGAWLASASKDMTAKVWDVESGELLHDLRGHQDYVFTAVFHPRDKNLLLTASRDGTARLWNLSAGTSEVVAEGMGRLRSAAFSASGRYFLVLGRDTRASLRDAETHEEVWGVEAGTGRHFTWGAFSPDESELLVTCLNGTVYVYDVGTGKEKLRLTGHNDEVAQAFYSGDGKTIYTVSHDSSIGTWDRATGNAGERIIGHAGYIWSGSLHPSEPLLLSAGADGTARLWNLDHLSRGLRETASGVDPKAFATSEVITIPYTTDVTYSQINHAWRLRDGYGRTGMAGGFHPVVVLSGESSFSADGRFRIDMRKPSEVFDTETGKRVAAMSPVATRAARFTTDSRRLALAIPYGVSVFDVEGWKKLFSTKPEAGEVPYLVEWDRTGTILAVLSRQEGKSVTSVMRLYSVPVDHRAMEQPELLLEHRAVEEQRDALRFSRDGKYLAFSVAEDRSIRVWSVGEKREVSKLIGHTGLVHSLDFSPDMSRLASASRDSTIRLWAPLDGREVLVLSRPKAGEQYNAVQFSADGELLYAPGTDGGVDVFDATARTGSGAPIVLSSTATP